MTGKNHYTYILTCGHTVTFGPPGAQPGIEMICTKHESRDAAQKIVRLDSTVNSRIIVDEELIAIMAPQKCRNGHAISLENTYYQSSGKRRCRPCLRDQKQARRAKAR